MQGDLPVYTGIMDFNGAVSLTLKVDGQLFLYGVYTKNRLFYAIGIKFYRSMMVIYILWK